MSDLSDSDTNEIDNEFEEDTVDDSNDNTIERLFDLSSRLQEYCRDRGLPIFNEHQTTAILLEMYSMLRLK